ncbi:SDR family NAD(P)-dependent oxidoreductase, partial [Streptomyces spectabilis]|uniref:SDR family NAD(P)-dependent oxidoreductase n=1 Tax=Streptomyces spectabilis TaxID=68270 RepID=UPI00340CE8E2
MPATALIELALHAGARLGCGRVEELLIEIPLILNEHDAARLKLIVGAPDNTGCRSLRLCAQPEDAAPDQPWICHARGMLQPATGEVTTDATVWPGPGATPISLYGFYSQLADAGYQYGPAFNGLRHLWRDGATSYAEAALDDDLQDQVSGYGVHPALLDAALHAILLDGQADPGQIRLPFSCNGITLSATGATRLRARITPTGPDTVSLEAVDSAGQPVLHVRSLTLRPISRHDAANPASSGNPLYLLNWRLAPNVGSGPGPAAANLDIQTVHDLSDLTAVRDGRLPDVLILSCVDVQGDGTETVRAPVCHVLSVLQEWLGDNRFDNTRLVVLTRGAVAAASADIPDLAQAGIWGLVRSAQSEYPDRITLLDTDPATPVMAETDAITATAIGMGEAQLAHRDGTLLIPQLAHVTGTYLVPPEDTVAWRIDSRGTGIFDDVGIVANPRLSEPLEPGQIRIAIRAAGMNFHDVAVALGLIEGQEAMGSEAAGVVLECAPDVTTPSVGDSVMGIVSAGFAPQAVVDHQMVTMIPASWSFVQAAATPVAFATAYHGLVDLADLHAGESVLIHTATGGVGMAAVQLARHLGAEVFATASRGKWDTLRSLGLDDEHVADSRDLQFLDTFRAVTNGRGIDVVLNSLTGESVDASLQLLASGGRFLEIGKTDLRDPETIETAHPGVSYHAFSMTSVVPARIQQILEKITALFTRGMLSPLPVRTWDLRRAPEALRFMAQARHIGKIVLTMPTPIDPGGTVLITGGTGTLGGLIARHLTSSCGARSLMLASRQGMAAQGAESLREELRELGARVEIVACDISDRDAVAEVLDQIPAEHRLTGIVHAAAVLDDGVITGLSAEGVSTVFGPKVDGALHLHELTRNLDLSFFVLFSSVAGVVGTAGQGNYAAANSVLDAVAHHRNTHGLSCTSLAWGLWQQKSQWTTALTGTDHIRLRRAGLLPIPTSQALAMFDESLTTPQAALSAITVDPQLTTTDAPPVLRGLARVAQRTATNTDTAGVAGKLATLTQAEGEQFLQDMVCSHAATVLGHPTPGAVHPQRAFKDQGFTSLTAVELRNLLANVVGARLPATLIFDHADPSRLAQYLWKRVLKVSARQHHTPATQPGIDADRIAIIGMGCRYPGGVHNPDDLWHLVRSGVDAIGGLPDNRGWNLNDLYDPDREAVGHSYVRHGGFLDAAEQFDAGFFGISLYEALAMDPQQRQLLETTWETLEDAGIDPTSLRGSRTGVIVGVPDDGYGPRSSQVPAEIAGLALTGTTLSVASGRIAYALGLEGPAVSVDTACSSSLVALHWACQSLRLSEADLVVCGGATIVANPFVFLELSRLQGLSISGRCKAFSALADGIGIAEGVGLLALERLSDAQRNGHPVLAVIRGSAVNQDGASNGLTAPNGPSQERVIRQALANAYLSASDV